MAGVKTSPCTPVILCRTYSLVYYLLLVFSGYVDKLLLHAHGVCTLDIRLADSLLYCSLGYFRGGFIFGQSAQNVSGSATIFIICIKGASPYRTKSKYANLKIQLMVLK